MPYPALQSAFDAIYPSGHQWFWRADFVNELPDAAISRHVEQAARLPTAQSTVHLYPIDGAAHDVGRNDTAFSYRDATWAEVIVGVDADPKNNSRIIEWTKTYWETLHPWSAGGAYVNFMMDEGEERVRATGRSASCELTGSKGSIAQSTGRFAACLSTSGCGRKRSDVRVSYRPFPAVRASRKRPLNDLLHRRAATDSRPVNSPASSPSQLGGRSTAHDRTRAGRARSGPHRRR
jgi:hypothetical protein